MYRQAGEWCRQTQHFFICQDKQRRILIFKSMLVYNLIILSLRDTTHILHNDVISTVLTLDSLMLTMHSIHMTSTNVNDTAALI